MKGERFQLYINLDEDSFPSDHPHDDIADILRAAADKIESEGRLDTDSLGYRNIGYFQNITINSEIVGSYAVKDKDGHPWRVDL
jgi:hypothetical protein